MPIPVLLVAGHRSVGDGGNPTERNLTDDLALAYQRAFAADPAFGPVAIIQAVDGDGDPTMTAGGLTGLALACGRWLAARSEPLSLMFDLHFNGAESAVHVIPPHNRRRDNRGPLTSTFPQGRVADDVAENNTLDLRLAESIAREIAAIPGMRLLGANGVMLECDTGVGRQNYRLGMMGATAPARLTAVRLTIEHGGTNDAGKPDFFDNCARAALRATRRTLGDRLETPPPGPEPAPEPAPSLAAWLFGEAQGITFNPSGPVSRLWLARGLETGCFPRLADFQVAAGVKYYLFADGWVVQHREGEDVRPFAGVEHFGEIS